MITEGPTRQQPPPGAARLGGRWWDKPLPQWGFVVVEQTETGHELLSFHPRVRAAVRAQRRRTRWWVRRAEKPDSVDVVILNRSEYTDHGQARCPGCTLTLSRHGAESIRLQP